MNIEDLLVKIQDLRSQLEAMNLSTQALWMIGGVALLFFVLSLREVLAWYLRTNQIYSELKLVRQQLTEIQLRLNEASLPHVEDGEEVETSTVKKSSGASNNSRFRFDH